MHTVFVLGAGASVHAGAPLMWNFLDEAEAILRHGPSNEDDANALELVFRHVAALQDVHAKAFLDLYNIEALFGAVEMAQTLGELGDATEAEVADLRKALVRVIALTLEQTTRFSVERGGIQPPYLMKQFANAIHRNVFGGPRNTAAILSFNYDIVCEVALQDTGIQYDYGLGEKLDRQRLPLLKLHGSLTWGSCPNCNTIVPAKGIPTGTTVYHDEEVRKASVSLRQSLQRPHCKGGSTCEYPVLVPPSWNKSAYHGHLGRVWRHAARQLRQAHNIVLIGYSVPESDSFFRYLFALGTRGTARLHRLVVINPDPDGSVERRVREMVGRGVQSRVERVKGERANGDAFYEAAMADLFGTLLSAQ